MAEHPSFQSPFVRPGEPVPGKTYRADGWQHLDTPRMNEEFWNDLLRIIGTGEFHLLSGGEMRRRTGVERWGTIMISPVGQERIAAFNAA